MINKNWGCSDECPSVIAAKVRFRRKHIKALTTVAIFLKGRFSNFNHDYIASFLWSNRT